MNSKVVVTVPNWNGKDRLGPCLDSLLAQSLKSHIIVVDNGSVDGSVEFVENNYPSIEIIRHQKNHGYAGGVNPGFRKAQEYGALFVAPFNNDAVAHPDWLKFLVEALDSNPSLGIATCKLMSIDQTYLDSTGDLYTTWGLPFPRGRGEPVSTKYDTQTTVFGASGGATLYRISMLDEIGLFDEDFFAYYEDIDLSWRAQLAGWKVAYVPSAIAYHQISATSNTLKGFATYQTIKNLPMVIWKNVPLRLLLTVLPRFALAYTAFCFSALRRGQFGPLIRGLFRSAWLLPKKLFERAHIQSRRKVSINYIKSILTYDLPVNARKLRAMRDKWWWLVRRKVDK